MTSTDKEKANQSEVSVVNETPILDPNTEVEIINLANPLMSEVSVIFTMKRKESLNTCFLEKMTKRKPVL